MRVRPKNFRFGNFLYNCCNKWAHFTAAVLASIGLLLSGHGNAIADPGASDPVGFLNALHQAGIAAVNGGSNQDLLNIGWLVCDDLKTMPQGDVAQNLLEGSNLDSLETAEEYVLDAQQYLCPGDAT